MSREIGNAMTLVFTTLHVRDEREVHSQWWRHERWGWRGAGSTGLS
jgi:hypothetical protein